MFYVPVALISFNGDLDRNLYILIYMYFITLETGYLFSIVRALNTLSQLKVIFY
jgi:hypothetical protein